MKTDYDILIIGGGLTGLAAARRAEAAGRSCLVVADSPGSLPYTSGAMDLLAVYPTETKRNRAKPWEAVSELIEQAPEHPYGRAGLARVRDSIKDFVAYLEQSRLAYHVRAEDNIQLITAAGTIKPTYAVPRSMRANVRALEQRLPTVILGFRDLVDFSPEQVVGNLRDRWPGIRAERLDLSPVLEQNRRLGAARLLDEFERPEFRTQLVEMIRPLLGQARFLGLPAVLGHQGVVQIIEELVRQLGVEVFEIPLASPSPPGTRLANQLKEDLLSAGVKYWAGAPIVNLKSEEGRISCAVREGRGLSEELRARSVVLATGRFFGGGLVAGRGGVVEPLVDLPVEVPVSRDDWHMNTFLGAPGHPINRVGVKVDHKMRPLSGDGRVLYKNLYAAGAILADHDWVREKSGAGISIATAYAAVESILEDESQSAAGARS